MPTVYGSTRLICPLRVSPKATNVSSYWIMTQSLDVTILRLSYIIPGQAQSSETALTLLASPSAAFTEGGAVEMVTGNQIYRIDIPNAYWTAMAAQERALLYIRRTNNGYCEAIGEVQVADQLARVKAFISNKRTQNVSTGVITVYHDDGTTPWYTLTPSEAAGIVTILSA